MRRSLAAVTLVLVVTGLSATFLSIAGAHPPRGKHIWRKHVKPHATQLFVLQPKDDATPPAPGATVSSSPLDPTPLPSPSPSAPAPAGDPDDDGIGSVLFGWAQPGGLGENLLEGVGFALLGLVGALVTTYLFLNELLPSMGGKADYELIGVELAEFKEKRTKTLTDREAALAAGVQPGDEKMKAIDSLFDDLDTVIARLEDRQMKVRRSMYLTALPMYLVLGAAFAVIFATNALQAILVGFGWTAVADRAGLKREIEVKHDKRADEIVKIKEAGDAKVAAVEAELKAQLKDVKDENALLLASNDMLAAHVGAAVTGDSGTSA